MIEPMTRETLLRVAIARQWVFEKSGKARRERYHLAAKEVAAALGVTTSAVLSWEKGTSQPRGPVAERWVQLIEDLETQAQEQTAKAA